MAQVCSKIPPRETGEVRDEKFVNRESEGTVNPLFWFFRCFLTQLQDISCSTYFIGNFLSPTTCREQWESFCYSCGGD